MATKTKSRINQSQQSTFHFRWWMALLLVILIAIIGLVVLRFSKASTADGPAPTGPIYWIGDSLSTGFLLSGGLREKLETAGYSPAFVNANPGRSITQAGFTPGVNALNAVDADNKNVCVNSIVASIKVYCANHNNSYNPVKDAKTIVLFIGTNPETDQTKSFSELQQELLTKLRAVNPDARYVWADIAAPGNYAQSISQDSLNFAHLGNPNTTTQDLINAFNDTRKRLSINQLAIYANAIKFNYNIISQYKFFWQDKFPTLLQFPQIDDQKDTQGFIVDGTHYSATGSDKLTTYIVNVLQTGSFAKPPVAIIPFDITQQVKIDLTNPPEYVLVNQPGISDTGCEQQNGFKTNKNFKGCKVTSAAPLVLKPNPAFKANAQSFMFPDTRASICVGSISTNKTQPITITFSLKGKIVTKVQANYGPNNDLAGIVACGITDKPLGEIDTITIISPVLAYMTSIALVVK